MTGGTWAASGTMDTSPERWSSALGDTLRAGYPPTASAVESPPARPESVMPSPAGFVARMRIERALLSLARRTAGRTPTRDERRLSEHYQRQLRALDNDEGPS